MYYFGNLIPSFPNSWDDYVFCANDYIDWR